MAEGERIDVGQKPLLSIITINYNQAETTRQFLESARGLTYPNYEIVVVDNASEPALHTQLDSTAYPHLRLIRSEINLGFTGGNNLGIDQARGDYFFIVNNDTELNAMLLELLLQPFGTDGRIGVVCPKIFFFDQPRHVQYAGYNAMNMFTGTATVVGYDQPDSEQYDVPGPTNFAHGCAMLVSKEVIDKVGRFAERFFLYYEELDWSQRILDAGFIIYYQPLATILHKESVSVGRNSPLRTYYLTRNRILYMRRHASWFQRYVFYTFFATLVLPKHITSYLFAGQTLQIRAFLRGILWNFRSTSASSV